MDELSSCERLYDQQGLRYLQPSSLQKKKKVFHLLVYPIVLYFFPISCSNSFLEGGKNPNDKIITFQ